MSKLCIVVSARASYSRIRSVLLNLKQQKSIEFRLVLVTSATLSKYGDLKNYIRSDGLCVDYEFESQLDPQSNTAMVKSTALTMLSLSDYFLNEKITSVLLVADRHETLAISAASAYMGIQTFHLQGGERTGNIDDKVRFANSFLSDYHFVATESARTRLLSMEFRSDAVFNVGCPSIDFAAEASRTSAKGIKFRGVGADPSTLLQDPFIVVLQHAETTSDIPPRAQIRETIRAVEECELGAFWIWPNSDRGGDELVSEIRAARESGKLKRVHFEKSLSPEEFLSLLNDSNCIVGNSSVSVREGSFLGIPAVNIGTRQKDRAVVQNSENVAFRSNDIKHAIVKQVNHGRFESNKIYGNGISGETIVQLLSKLL